MPNKKSRNESQTFILDIPAIMCEGCVGAIRRLLSPYALNQNPDKYLIVDVKTKQATITVPKSIQLKTLLDVVVKSGKGKNLKGRLKEEIDSKKALTFSYKLGNVKKITHIKAPLASKNSKNRQLKRKFA